MYRPPKVGCCQNPNHDSTQPQPNISLVGLDFAYPTPPAKTQCQQYISCNWPNFDETLTVGSWEHLEHQWYLSRQHLSRRHLSISRISLLLLTIFWCNFKSRILGTSSTDPNCHGDICPGNICPGYICQYQEYLNCYWHDLDQTLKAGSRQGEGKIKGRSRQDQSNV